jgi:hypothetical protein
MNGQKVTEKGGEGLYLLCFARAGLLPHIEGKGIDGRSPLFLWRVRDVVAVLCRISLADFCGASAERRMRDISWLGPRVCRHEKVVEHVMRHSPVFPARFGTIFSSLESLESLLERHGGEISCFLDRVADKEEWAVKGFLDRARAREGLFSTSLSARSEALASLSPGTRYVEQKRIHRGMEKEVTRWLSEVLKRVANDFSRQSSDFRERKVLGGENRRGDMILNWAFLVSRSGVVDFRRRVDSANADFSQRGLTFELSGPWPPYSFCPSLEKEDEG